MAKTPIGGILLLSSILLGLGIFLFVTITRGNFLLWANTIFYFMISFIIFFVHGIGDFNPLFKLKDITDMSCVPGVIVEEEPNMIGGKRSFLIATRKHYKFPNKETSRKWGTQLAMMFSAQQTFRVTDDTILFSEVMNATQPQGAIKYWGRFDDKGVQLDGHIGTMARIFQERLKHLSYLMMRKSTQDETFRGVALEEIKERTDQRKRLATDEGIILGELTAAMPQNQVVIPNSPLMPPRRPRSRRGDEEM